MSRNLQGALIKAQIERGVTRAQKPVSEVGYAHAVGIFCADDGRIGTGSLTGAWRKSREFCPGSLSDCASIIPNSTQKLQLAAKLLTTTLPPLDATTTLLAMRDPTATDPAGIPYKGYYTTELDFSCADMNPTVQVYKHGLVGVVWVSKPVLQDNTNARSPFSQYIRRSNSFKVQIIVQAAPMTPEVMQMLTTRSATGGGAATQNLQGYLQVPTIHSFKLFVQIGTRNASTNQEFNVNITRQAA